MAAGKKHEHFLALFHKTPPLCLGQVTSVVQKADDPKTDQFRRVKTAAQEPLLCPALGRFHLWLCCFTLGETRFDAAVLRGKLR